MPIKNDANSARYLVQQLFNVFQDTRFHLSIFLIDDASDEAENKLLKQIASQHQHVHLVETEARLGHQKALLVGIREVSLRFNTVPNLVLMDSDGEDKPEDAVKLANSLLDDEYVRVVFSQRGKRESPRTFKVLYAVFSATFRRLTGVPLDIGNFMSIRGSWVKVLLDLPHVENHISMSAKRYSPSFHMIRNDRGARYVGKSKMNLAGLALHGYGAVTVYADLIMSRLLLLAIPAGSIAIIAALVLILMKIFGFASFLQGWVSIVSLFLLGFGFMTVIQLLTTTLVLLSIQKDRKERYAHN